MNHDLVYFTKMHGLGNDFVVINALKHSVSFTPAVIKQLADRHTGIGFDQLLMIEPAKTADFFCRIFNSDGSEAEQCGNGLRCVARFIHEEGLSTQTAFRLETIAGIYPVHITNYDHIQIAMGAPQIKAALTELTLGSPLNPVSLSILSVGNPHAIVKVDAMDAADIDQLAAQLSQHSQFPDGVNIGFMQIIDQSHIRLRTFERGAGETFACGSNACAAAVAGMVNGWLAQQVSVQFRYGSLQIKWDEATKTIEMTGPATSVFKGTFNQLV